MRILQRYVLVQLLKVFTLLVLALTFMLVVVGVVGEASKSGLGPVQILQILPWVVPSLMPYTIPATLLLTVCVVYGRMAGDQEITAIKSAGINVLVVMWPAFILASLLSLGTFVLTDYFIPLATSRIEKIITLAMEDIFLDVLRARNQYTDTDHGIAISVTKVEDKVLVNPVFRYSAPGGRPSTVMATKATLKFDMEKREVLLSFSNGSLLMPDGTKIKLAPEEQLPVPLPQTLEAPKARNMTISSIRSEMTTIAAQREDLVARRTMNVAFWLTRGEFAKLSPVAEESIHFQRKLNDATERWTKRNTEIHSRGALASSCFFFVLLGAPFAVRQGKRQFLTSFALCFAPILTIYYPIVLLTMELSKDNKINPAWGMWLGNGVILVASGFVLRGVLKH